jgi:transcription elongation factor GreB
MNKAFVKEADGDDEDDVAHEGSAPIGGLPAAYKNYIRPSGLQRLKDELLSLLDVERPEVVKIVSWAASNGDRSENGDYLYGKKRLREIDRRIRFLTKRIDAAVVVDPALRASGDATDQIFFGATVAYREDNGSQRVVTIVGVDEADSASGYISWVSPVATALIKAREGDEVVVRTPQGNLTLEIEQVRYTDNQ